MTSKDPELLPCQVSDEQIEAGLGFLYGLDHNLGRNAYDQFDAEIERQDIIAFYTAMNNASTIPTDGELTEAAQIVRGMMGDQNSSLIIDVDRGLRADEATLAYVLKALERRAALSIQSGKGMREALTEVRAAIASLDVEALGMVRQHPSGDLGNGYAYSIRDELLSKIDAALADQDERG